MTSLNTALSGRKSPADDHQDTDGITYLKGLIEQHEELSQTDQELASEIRASFIQRLIDEPNLLQIGEFADFLAHEIEPEEIADIEWPSPRRMMHFSESLYQTRFVDEKRGSLLRQQASLLFRQALHQFEEAGEMEKMIGLLRLTPTYLLRRDEELSRLHYRANVYETRRVRRARRFLYGYLLLQFILVLFVFPFLFINAENGKLQQQVEQLADVELGDEGYQLITYSEGVYWAVITAASIGYGDITPTTTTGRIIAGMLGTMGVITVGIIAGLVLQWITPRRMT